MVLFGLVCFMGFMVLCGLFGYWIFFVVVKYWLLSTMSKVCMRFEL